MIRDILRQYAKSPFAIGASVLALLLLLAWIVSVRLGDAEMTSDMPIAFVTPDEFREAAQRTEGDMPAADVSYLAPSMPPFAGIEAWLNSPPLTSEMLRGKVVLIDFWTYSCINCIRTLPYVTGWHERYKDRGFTVVGVHTPEFAFEKDEKNVRAAIARHGITYPVALDNAYGTWNNYSNRYWPAHYLFDAMGRLRYTHFGEGEYDQMEANIRALLAEAGEDAGEGMAGVDAGAAPSFDRIGTRETYLGYARMEFLGSPEELVKDGPQAYTAAAEPARNRFYYVGTWNVGDERAVSVEPDAGITYRYTASAANLVMGTPNDTVRAEVTLDGQPVPAALRGADIIEDGGKTYVDVSGQRLYNLIDARGDYATRTLRIRFLQPNVEVYAFTFG